MTSSLKEEIIECTTNENDFEMSENEMHENVQEIEPTVFNDEINNDLPTEREIQMPIINEIIENKNLTSSLKKEIIECNTSEKESKIFICYICNKEYNMYFYLKQHIKEVHEKKKSCYTQQSIMHNNQEIDKSFDKKSDKSIS